MTNRIIKRWNRPDQYTGAKWPEYFVFLGRNRDSDDLTESNFHVALNALGGESDTVRIIRENHWACGWLEWIAIHESNTEALDSADEMLNALSDYPVLDDQDWSEREQDSADKIWADCYDVESRLEYIRANRSQFNFHNMADLIGCVRGNYFAGHASELLT